jgi:hypothetical protein
MPIRGPGSVPFDRHKTRLGCREPLGFVYVVVAVSNCTPVRRGGNKGLASTSVNASPPFRGRGKPCPGAVVCGVPRKVQWAG